MFVAFRVFGLGVVNLSEARNIALWGGLQLQPLPHKKCTPVHSEGSEIHVDVKLKPYLNRPSVVGP